MTRVNRAVLAIIVAAGICAPVFAQPKDKATDPKAAPTATQPDKAPKADKPKDPQGMPPGMTEEDMKDMKAYEEAATPGPMHQWLTNQAGTYEGKTKMWMKPGAPAQESTCKTTITSLYEGRYIKVESTGPMPGMGDFHGQGVYGYDNVTKQFTSCWFDNMSTGIMHGTGTLSTDQKTLTITSSYNCPIQKKEVSMKETWSFKPDGGMVLEMFGPDKTGKEFKMMEITYTGKTGAAPAKANGGTDLKAKPSDTVPAKK
jgi:Protein of unknown function (DUF1579)